MNEIKPVTIYRSVFALSIFVVGSLQAWDSGVPEAGLGIVFLVSLATAIPAVMLLLPLKLVYYITSVVLAFALLIIARLISPLSLPGLFIILTPAAAGLIFTGIFEQKLEKR